MYMFIFCKFNSYVENKLCRKPIFKRQNLKKSDVYNDIRYSCIFSVKLQAKLFGNPKFYSNVQVKDHNHTLACFINKNYSPDKRYLL